MKRFLLVILWIISSGRLLAQQDAQLTQYVFNGLFINPAYAGYQEHLNFSSLYRYQWTGIKGAPRTTTLAVDASVKDDNVGLAFQVMSDKLGAQNNLSVYANYAYRKLLDDDNNSRLAFGLGVGFLNAQLNENLLNPNDINDPEISHYLESSFMPDARVGVFLSNQKYFVSAAANNMISGFLMRNKILAVNMIRPRPHYYLSAGFITPVAEGIKVKPFFLIKDDIGGPTSLDLNTFFLLGDRMWIGAGYRTGIKVYNKKNLDNNIKNSNSLLALMEYHISPRLSFGYSYDNSAGSLQGISGGSHEISVRFALKNFYDKEYIRCYF